MTVQIGDSMNKKYNADWAEIIKSDLEASSIIQNTSVETIKSIIRRMGIDYEDGFPKEVYISAFLEELCSDSKWILQMLPRNILEFLLEIWEHNEIEVNKERWDFIQYLKIFGFLTYKKGNPLTEEPNQIYVIEEMKDYFYFLLKSRKSKALMEEYDGWEKIISGLLYYYGLIEMSLLYGCFITVLKKQVDYEEFISFIKSRCTLWSFGLILKETRNQKEYYQYVNVENAEIILLYIQEHKDLPYKQLKKEDLFYVYEAAGIDNRWKGVTELGTLFVDQMHMDYYRATVLVKTLILMIQNSCELEQIKEKISVLSFENKKIKQEAEEALNILYENVPVFELKGFSRNEYYQMFYQKQLKKKKEMFRIIDGGRKKL